MLTQYLYLGSEEKNLLAAFDINIKKVKRSHEPVECFYLTGHNITTLKRGITEIFNFI